MLRKLAICVLLIPLPLNGLWMVCREAPPEAQKLSRTYAGADENLFEKFATVSDDDASALAASDKTPADDSSSPECKRICAFRAGGPACMFLSGGKASMTIIVFGVAIPPAEAETIADIGTSNLIAEYGSHYRSPNLMHFTPPPEA